MKVVRASTRLSLLGGGCDHPSYYEKYGATIVSCAINRYVYLIWNDRPTGGCRLSYSEIEEVSSLTECKHTLVQKAAKKWGVKEPCTLSIISDVPKGTGLGSSSVLAVCLCQLLNAPTLIPDAMLLEQEVSPNIGLQDGLPAVYGGFRIYQLGKDTSTRPVLTARRVPQSAVDIINTYGMLLYTGVTRDSAPILTNWHKSEKTLHRVRELAEFMAGTVEYWTPEDLGQALSQAWELKAGIKDVTSETLQRQYATLMGAGCLGAKLIGAGGGGCWLALAPPSLHEKVRHAVGLIEIPFQIAEEGVREWTI